MTVRAHLDAHQTHMSPAQAAHTAGVSRWTIMRAIKSHDLKASRDNRNQWRIASDALHQWMLSTVRTPEPLHTPTPSHEATDLLQRLSEQTARANLAEAMLTRERELNAELKNDRDQWRDQATALLSASPKKRSRWWPW